MIHRQQVKMVEDIEKRLGAKYTRGGGEDPVRMVLYTCKRIAGWYVEHFEL